MMVEKKMKALLWRGIKTMDIEETDIPSIAPKEILARPLYSTICGSDRHAYYRGLFTFNPPFSLGHEFCSEIVQLGEEVDEDVEGNHLHEGDLIVAEPSIFCGKCYYCRRSEYIQCPHYLWFGCDRTASGSFSDYVKVRSEVTYKMLPGMTVKQGALVEPAAVGLHAVRRSNVGIGKNVLIFGGGPIGLFTLMAGRAAGAEKIFLSEVSKFRSERALRLGANVVVDPNKQNLVKTVMEGTRGLGADIVIDTAGAPTTVKQGVAAAKKHGIFTRVAISQEESSLNFTDLMVKELSVIGSQAYCFWPYLDMSTDFYQSMLMLSDDRFVANEIVTHEYDFEDWKEAFEMSGEAEKAVKVAIRGRTF
jgi:threonine dehydrogenase-like Zn-dependent dehydrogenase